MELFQIQQTPGRRAFKLVGELDLSNSHALSALEELSPQGDVALDLAELRFIDGAGLECFERIARRIDGRLCIDNARPSIEKLLRRSSSQVPGDHLKFRTTYSVPSDHADQMLPDPARSLVSAYSPESICRRLVGSAAASIGSASFVGVIIVQDGQPTVAAGNHRSARELDSAQIKCADGPSLDALQVNQTTHSASLLRERRWQEFTNKALYDGVASVASIPLLAEDRAVGVLSLYGQKEHGFSPESLDVATRLGQQSAFLIANSLLYWNAKELVGQMTEALRSRAVIEQAKGVLMGRAGMSADEAFSALRAESQRHNLKVRDLAQQILQVAASTSTGRSTKTSGLMKLRIPSQEVT